MGCAQCSALKSAAAGSVENAGMDLNAASSRQQVTARFITESQPSWEARGAAMLGEYPGPAGKVYDLKGL